MDFGPQQCIHFCQFKIRASWKIHKPKTGTLRMNFVNVNMHTQNVGLKRRRNTLSNGLTFVFRQWMCEYFEISTYLRFTFCIVRSHAANGKHMRTHWTAGHHTKVFQCSPWLCRSHYLLRRKALRIQRHDINTKINWKSHICWNSIHVSTKDQSKTNGAVIFASLETSTLSVCHRFVTM